MAQTPNRPQQQSSATSANDDVGNLDQYIQKADYDVTKEEIFKRLEALEARVKDKAAMVATLKDVLEGDRNVDPVMADYIEKHIDIEPLVKRHVDVLDGRQVKAFMKKAGFAVIGLIYTLALIAATAWITTTVNSHADKNSSSSNHAK